MFIQDRFARPNYLGNHPLLNQRAQVLARQAGPTVGPSTPKDAVQLSDAAQLAGSRTGPQNLMLFGGDRKTAIETLVGSGAKAENPKLGFFKNTLRKIFGGTTTASKRISGEQTIHTKVKNRNFNLKALRLSTKEQNPNGGETVRHVDFATKTPTGKNAQVKDVGSVIAQGTPTRMFEQEHSPAAAGKLGEVKSSYYDPKTGQKFLQTKEIADKISADKAGTLKSSKNKNTLRQIEVLGDDGQADRRYTFDYRTKKVKLDNLGPDGNVTSSYNMSKKTDYFKLVEQLSKTPPSSKPAASTTPVSPAFRNRFEMARVALR